MIEFIVLFFITSQSLGNEKSISVLKFTCKAIINTSKRFDITMNDERVDVTDTVFDILYERHPKATGVWADGSFKQLFQDARPVEKQSLGTCLLTATAFYKLLTES